MNNRVAICSHACFQQQALRDRPAILAINARLEITAAERRAANECGHPRQSAILSQNENRISDVRLVEGYSVEVRSKLNLVCAAPRSEEHTSELQSPYV